MEFAIGLLSSAAVSGFLTATLIWLSRSWISERLKNSIRNEYDQKLETHKAQLKAQSDLEIEKFRSTLSMNVKEHEVRFAGLHEKRGEVIAELYGLLVEAVWDASKYASPLEMEGEPSRSEKYATAMKAITTFYRFFAKNRIYLPESLCDKLETFVEEMRSKAINLNVHEWEQGASVPGHLHRDRIEAWSATWAYFEKEAPKAKKAMEDALRALLGSET